MVKLNRHVLRKIVVFIDGVVIGWLNIPTAKLAEMSRSIATQMLIQIVEMMNSTPIIGLFNKCYPL
jgi:hypothetical protein